MAYVWSPVTGTVTSTNCICNCLGGCNTVDQCRDSSCKHNASAYWLGVWPGPEDICAVEGTQVYFSASSSVLSIRLVRKRICQKLPETDEATRALEVQMYSQPNAGGTLLGKVLYGHVTNRVADGTVRNISSYGNNWDNAPSIGSLARAASQAWCSNGPHVHLECSSNGVRNPLCCGDHPTAKGHLIYVYS